MSVPDDKGGRGQLVGSEEDTRVTQWLHQRVDEHVCRRHKNSERLSIGCTRQMQGIDGASGRSVVRFSDALVPRHERQQTVQREAHNQRIITAYAFFYTPLPFYRHDNILTAANSLLRTKIIHVATLFTITSLILLAILFVKYPAHRCMGKCWRCIALHVDFLYFALNIKKSP